MDNTKKAVFLSHETIYTEGAHFATFRFDQHLIEVESRNLVRYCINVSPNVLHFACSRNSMLLNMFDSANPSYPVTTVKDSFTGQFLDLVKNLDDNSLSHGNDIYKKGPLLMCVALVYDHFMSLVSHQENDPQLPELIYSIIEYVDSNIDSTLTLDKLSDALHFSTYYLSPKFKDYTGIPIGKYILDKKMDLAKNLLAVHDAKNVSRRIGYKNYSSFFQNFRKYTGMSPSDYRAQLLNDKKSHS